MLKLMSGLPVLEFRSQQELRSWLEQQSMHSDGIWVRLFKKASRIESITFEQLLDEGLCFGWSESVRQKYDEHSYLQKFTPRKSKGTQSERNRRHIQALIESGKMTQAGLDVL